MVVAPLQPASVVQLRCAFATAPRPLLRNTTRSHIRRHTVARTQSHRGGLGAAPVNIRRRAFSHERRVMFHAVFLAGIHLEYLPLSDTLTEVRER